MPTARPVAYASPQTDAPLSADLPPATWRTAAAAAWLVATLAALAYVAVHLCDDQQTLANVLRDLKPAGVSLVTLVAAVTAGAGPAVFAVAVGMVAAAVGYDRPVNRLAPLAAAPVVVGCWSALMLVTYVVPTVAQLTALVAAIALQCGLVFAGTRLGRPAARWLARRVLPPPLRVHLVALWV